MAQLKDTVISGSLRATDSLLTTTLQTKILNAPTESNGTSYGPGSNNNVLKSNATSIFWGTLAKSEVGLGNVENIALSTWIGTNKITTLGTVTTGTWSATEIAVNKGGTGKTSWTPWGIIYASANTTLAQVTAGAAGNNGYLLESKGAAAPGWIQATNSNTASTIVKRDASGNFSAGTITATLSGSATSLSHRASLTKGTNPSSSTWLTHMTNFETGTGTDTKNRIGGYMDSMIDTDGSTYFYLRAYRFTADSTDQNTIMLGCDNQGNCSYSVSDAAAFRSAISAPSTTGSNASGTWDISITGNAASATALSTSGTAAKFWRGDNTWSNALTGNISIGSREVTTGPSSITYSNRITIVPYFHTGGPWYIKSGDDASNAWLSIYYGSSQLLRMKHDGTQALDWKGNAATASTSSKVTIAAGAGTTMYPIALVGSYSASAQSIYVSQNVKASNTALSVSGTITAANVTLNADGRLGKASGNLYIGDSGNSGWVLTQDICSHWGTGDTYWSLRVAGTAHFKAAYGAVWNDYAEMRNVPKAQIDIHRIYDDKGEVERDYPYAGHCVYEIGNGTMELTNTRLAKGCKIISDTFGFCIGETEDSCTPIAVTGRVLAYPYESIEEYKNHIGDCVCSGPNGTISIMTQEEKIKYPECIVGTISEIPTYGVWHCGNKLTKPIKVNGRIWIYVK